MFIRRVVKVNHLVVALTSSLSLSPCICFSRVKRTIDKFATADVIQNLLYSLIELELLMVNLLKPFARPPPTQQIHRASTKFNVQTAFWQIEARE